MPVWVDNKFQRKRVCVCVFYSHYWEAQKPQLERYPASLYPEHIVYQGVHGSAAEKGQKEEVSPFIDTRRAPNSLEELELYLLKRNVSDH